MICRDFMMSVSDFYRTRTWLDENSSGREMIWPLVRGWVICVTFQFASDAIAFRTGSAAPWIMLDDVTVVLRETDWTNLDPKADTKAARMLIGQLNVQDRCAISEGIEATFGFRSAEESSLFGRTLLARNGESPS